jgi:hypothetical protein
MGRTIPSWRMVVEAELEKFSKFRNSLPSEDRIVFEDLLNQCKLYASAASTLASPVKEVPMIISMLFAQHKKILELEERLKAGEKNTFTQHSDEPQTSLTLASSNRQTST